MYIIAKNSHAFTRKKDKCIFKHINLNTMKKILILFVFVFFLSGCSSDNNSESGSSNSINVCFANSLSLNEESTVEVLLVNKDIPIEGVERNEFTKEMLTNMQYGSRFTIRDEDFYGSYELCNTDTNEASYINEYAQNENEYFDQTPNSLVGSFTDFFSSAEEMDEFEAGNYSVNVFSKRVGSDDWVYVGSRKFSVVE